MRVSHFACAIAVASLGCSSSNGGTDSDAADSADVASDTGQAANNCSFSEPMEIDADYTGPTTGDTLTYRLTIEVCLPGQIEGIRREAVFDRSDDVLCTSTSRFSATATFSGTWCDRCTALTGAVFAEPVQAGNYCTEAGITANVPTDFDGNPFETLALQDEGMHSNDVLYLDQDGNWVSMVPPISGVDTKIFRSFMAFDDGPRATIRYERENIIFGQ